ncbi:MAG: nucleotidyltransferase family protein [Methylococcaceae bacterium]|nr:nucleotidyltransferase family protein [Methylococcaceae bacterium]
MSDESSRVAGLLLAAGLSSRLGRPKQLVLLEGIPLVRRASLAALASGCDRVFVVVGANRTPIVEAIADLDVETIVNRAWQEGIGSSVRAGVERISSCTPGYSAVLVMLADQIKIGTQHLDPLIEAFRRYRGIAASEYDNTLGVPALFPRRYFDELRLLAGDTGAKSMLRKYASRVTPVSCPEASADLDTPENLQTLR